MLFFYRIASGFLKLGKAHLGTLWVLLEDALVGLLPLLQNVLQAVIGLSLRSLDQITNLQAFLSQFYDTLVVLGKDFTLAHLKLLQVALLFSCERFLLARLSVYSLGQDALLLVQVL